MAADSVVVGYVHDNHVSHSWHTSLLGLLSYDITHHGRLLQGGWLAMRYGADGLPMARNKTAAQFLDMSADWLFWVDTDMGFAPDTVDRLLEVADPVERPIMGALCFAHRERVADSMGGYRCMATATIYDWCKQADAEGFLGRAQYPVSTLVRCAGTGSACIIIHRSVFERISEYYGPVWYDRVPNKTTGQLISEDLSFCLRAGALAVPVHVYTGVRTTHHKEFWLAEEDFWSRAVAPSATASVAVLVPVLNRPGNAASFMQSLRASTGLATVYAIVSPGDAATEGAWRAAGAEVIRGDAEWLGDDPTQAVAHTFAEKANLGYRQTSEPWVFITGDDVQFQAGWLDHSQAIAGDNYHVIGTNDLVNPRTTAGEHATHLLLRRSYIDEHGASWDGPKVLAHEGYHHNYVDDEIVTVAKQRSVWAMALGAVVEHFHPMAGKAPMDSTYQLGAEHMVADRELFTKRLRTHGEVT